MKLYSVFVKDRYDHDVVCVASALSNEEADELYSCLLKFKPRRVYIYKKEVSHA